jgi:hypothetical protein
MSDVIIYTVRRCPQTEQSIAARFLEIDKQIVKLQTTIKATWILSRSPLYLPPSYYGSAFVISRRQFRLNNRNTISSFPDAGFDFLVYFHRRTKGRTRQHIVGLEWIFSELRQSIPSTFIDMLDDWETVNCGITLRLVWHLSPESMGCLCGTLWQCHNQGKS